VCVCVCVCSQECVCDLGFSSCDADGSLIDFLSEQEMFHRIKIFH